MRYIENGNITHFLGAHCLTFFAPFATLRPDHKREVLDMQIEKFSKITVEMEYKGERYSVTFVPKTVKPLKCARPESAPFDDSAIRKAILDLGYDDTCVDGTAINRHLGGDVPTRTLGYALDALGYDTTVRFKCSKDGITHYVRYNSILITASDAVAKIKGR